MVSGCQNVKGSVILVQLTSDKISQSAEHERTNLHAVQHNSNGTVALQYDSETLDHHLNALHAP